MNFDFGFITEITKQTLGIFLSMFQVSTSAGQGMMKIVDFFGALGNLAVKAISSIGAFFGGLAG